MIRRPPRSTQSRSSAASDVYKRQALRTQIFAEDRGEASNVAAGPVSADFHAGLLVKPIPALNVMAGWDSDCFTAGLGVRYKALGLDYAWRNGSPDELGSSQRLSLSYTW